MSLSRSHDIDIYVTVSVILVPSKKMLDIENPYVKPQENFWHFVLQPKKWITKYAFRNTTKGRTIFFKRFFNFEIFTNLAFKCISCVLVVKHCLFCGSYLLLSVFTVPGLSITSVHHTPAVLCFLHTFPLFFLSWTLVLSKISKIPKLCDVKHGSSKYDT